MLYIKQTKFNSVCVEADSHTELMSAFMRLSEHYEGTAFKDKIFTVGEFRRWYSQKYGGNTFEQDWAGFNIPSTALQYFKEGLFDPLLPAEQELIDLLKYRNDFFYIIATNDPSTLRHELAHALYSHSTAYYDKINDLFDKESKRLAKAKKYILDMGYNKSVLYDELQAYITDNDNKFLISNIDSDIIRSVNKLYNQYNK